MTREEAIRELKADYCGNRIICELYPDQCNREDCEIWLAIKALETQPDGDAVSRQDAIRIVDSIDTWQAGWRGDAIESLKALPSAQPNLQPACNQLATDCISRQAVKYKLTALVNELEEIFSHIREHNVDDSVCGLCEYDGAYIGESGDWCNECPGFDKDDCFKLKEKYREEWLKIDG